MAKRYLIMSLASFLMLVLGAIFGGGLYLYGSFSFNEVASEEDFEYDSSWYEGYYSYASYLCTLDGEDLGTTLTFYIESELNSEIVFSVTVLYGGDKAESIGTTPFEMSRYVGTVDEVEVYIDIEDGYDFDDLSITIETNNNFLVVCLGPILGISCSAICLLAGIVFLVLHVRSRRTETVDTKYRKEIRDLEKKIAEMEKLGLDTARERKLLEDYKRQ